VKHTGMTVAGILIPSHGSRSVPEIHVLFLAACMLLGAALYTSVGHAGASAYIALMALFGVAPATMRPTALALNILVSTFTSARFLNAGLFRWRVPGHSRSEPFRSPSSAARCNCPAHTTARLSVGCCC